MHSDILVLALANQILVTQHWDFAKNQVRVAEELLNIYQASYRTGTKNFEMVYKVQSIILNPANMCAWSFKFKLLTHNVHAGIFSETLGVMPDILFFKCFVCLWNFYELCVVLWYSVWMSFEKSKGLVSVSFIFEQFGKKLSNALLCICYFHSFP